MAGWSRIRIFNPLGNLIDELEYPTRRSWVLNSQTSAVGRCEFTVNTYDAASGGYNPKLTLANFSYGNLVLVEHRPSVNADGSTNGLLPPWVGVLLPPQTWEYGKVKFTAYSVERLLAFRPLYNVDANVDGHAGGHFSRILKISNQWASIYGGIAIQSGNVDLSGGALIFNYGNTAYPVIQYIANYSHCDWDVTPQVSASNQLQLFGNWYPAGGKGVNSGVVLSNYNTILTSPLYTEQGDFYNGVYAQSDAQTNGTRVVATSVDQTSIAQSGILAGYQVFRGTSGAAQPVIQALADAYVAQNKTPVRTFAPTLLDVDNAFSFAAIGNTFLIQNDTVGFYNGGIGVSGPAKVTAAEYDELSNSVKMAVALL